MTKRRKRCNAEGESKEEYEGISKQDSFRTGAEFSRGPIVGRSEGQATGRALSVDVSRRLGRYAISIEEVDSSQARAALFDKALGIVPGGWNVTISWHTPWLPSRN